MFDLDGGGRESRRPDAPGGGASGSEGDTDRLWLVGGIAMLVWLAWSKRDAVVAMWVPYGLSAPNRGPTGHVVAGYHLTTAGWLTLGVLVAALVAALVCVGAGMRWVRWRRGGGVEAVPPVPAVSAGLMIGAGLLVVGVLALHWPVWAAWVLGACGGVITWLVVDTWGQRYRTLAAFTGRADQVLGHSRPGIARLSARSWRRRDDGGVFPGTIVATTGPGWQNKPAEHAELGRYATEFGWPGRNYTWRFDPIRRQVTGTIATGGQ